MIKEIYPKFNEHKEEFEDELFLYSDRDILSKQILFKEKIYKVQESSIMDLPGQVEDPIHSVERALVNTYEWHQFNKKYCHTYLICFQDFIPNPHSDAKQLTFKIYNLQEKNN